MQKFLGHLLICLASVLAVNFVYAFVIGGKLREYELKYRSLPKSFRTLILGDSHANAAWKANDDQMKFNFAAGSDNVVDLKYKFLYAAAGNSYEGKKIVILPFDAHCASPYRLKMNNNRLNVLLNEIPVNRQIVYSLPLFFDPVTEVDLKSYLYSLTHKERPRKFSVSQSVARFRDQFPVADPSSEVLAQYQDLINLIREKQYDVIGVIYPLHPYYDSMIRANPKSGQYINAFDSLARVNHMKVYDFSAEITQPELFRDQDHVNSAGSEVFVETFNQVLAK